MCERSCFNCKHSKPDTQKLDNVIFRVAPCQNEEVDEQLLACLDEYALPQYCNHHEFKDINS